MKTFGLLISIAFILLVGASIFFDYNFFQDEGFDPFWTSMATLALVFLILLFGKPIDKFIFGKKYPKQGEDE
jgi:hypothetical protein